MHARLRIGIDTLRQREFFIDNLLVRIHFIIVMIRWTGLAPWEFEFPFPGGLTSTFLEVRKTDPFRSSPFPHGLGISPHAMNYEPFTKSQFPVRN